MNCKNTFIPISSIVIVGISWPEVEGICYFYKDIYDDCFIDTCYSVKNIFNLIDKHPERGVILLIQPHNNAYLLYRVSQKYPQLNIKIIANELYFSDIVILETLGFKDFTTFDDFIKLNDMPLSYFRKSKLFLLKDMNELDFLKFINNKIITQLYKQGLTMRQQCILSLAVKGKSNEVIASLLNISSKTVSAHKIDALNRLPYGNHRYALTKGLQAQYPYSLS